MTDELLVARDGFIVTLTLNRPDHSNAFSRALLAALSAAIAELSTDETARAVIINGAGGKVFCAGADLKERSQMTPDEAIETVRTIRETISALDRLPMPVIAFINGHALGGGLELALACDVRVIAEQATVALPETTLAIIPGGGGTARLVRLVGPGRAKEMIFTGRRLDATEAAEIGLVEKIGTLDDAREIASRIASNGPLAVRAAKRALRVSHDAALDDALRSETDLYESILNTKDRLEGLAAFGEKRTPVYRGE
ncbi:MAG: enoyl-CoA hydratase-related protein [Actinomycetota bacterium]